MYYRMNSYQISINSIGMAWKTKRSRSRQIKKKPTTTITKQFMQRRQCNACTVTWQWNSLWNVHISEKLFSILQLDFWTHPSKPSNPVDIHVPRRKLREFKHILAKRSIPFTVKIRNVQRQIKVEGMRPRSVSFNGAFRSYAQVSLSMIWNDFNDHQFKNFPYWQTSSPCKHVLTMIQNYSSPFGLKIWSRKLFPVNTYRRFVLFS